MTMNELRTLVTGRGLVESPRWHGDRLYFSDWSAGEVIAADLGGRSEVIARVKSLPLCTAWLPDGRLIIVSSQEGLLLRLEPDGSLVTHANLGRPGWNDIVADGRGSIYVNGAVSGVILASVQLIEDSAFDVDSFVADRIGEAIGRKLAQEVYSGTGATACLGINTALNARGSVGTSGGSIAATGGYVTLGAATKVPVFGNYSTPTLSELAGNVLSPTTILAMMMAVDPVYYKNAKFYLNAQQAWNLRSVTDGNGRPLLNFMNGLSADDVTNADYTAASPVAQLFGFPVVIDNSISNLTASTTGGPVFGDLSKAMVLRVVRNDARVVTNSHPVVPTTMRLAERYADFLQVGYLGYLRVDSRSNDLRAAVTVKPAAT